MKIRVKVFVLNKAMNLNRFDLLPGYAGNGTRKERRVHVQEAQPV